MSDTAPIRLVATVRGRVQGVGFRWYVRREAERLGLSGWVANRSDGGVDVIAEGPTDALATLADRLASGPLGSSVTSVERRDEPARGGLDGFSIRSGGHRGD